MKIFLSRLQASIDTCCFLDISYSFIIDPCIRKVNWDGNCWLIIDNVDYCTRVVKRLRRGSSFCAHEEKKLFRIVVQWSNGGCVKKVRVYCTKNNYWATQLYCMFFTYCWYCTWEKRTLQVLRYQVRLVTVRTCSVPFFEPAVLSWQQVMCVVRRPTVILLLSTIEMTGVKNR